MTACIRLLLIGVMLAAWSGSALARQPGAAMEVHELEADLAKREGDSLKVTGRFGSATGRKIRLKASAIEFQLAPGAANPRSGFEQVELSGRLERAGNRWRFLVDSWGPVADDAEQAARRKMNLKEGDFAALRELAAWADQRAQWYGDVELKGVVDELLSTARTWEEQSARVSGDSARLREMAEEWAKGGAALPEVERLRHAAVAIDFEAARADADLSRLEAEVLEELSGADVPTDEARQAVWPAYRQDRLQVYEGVEHAQRTWLHRCLWVDLVQRRLNQAARKPEVDFVALASEARRLLPDVPGLADQLQRLGLERDEKSVGTLSRLRALALAKRWTELGEPERGKATIRNWLDAQRRGLKPEVAEERCELAADYLELVQDERAAADLWIEAIQRVPNLSDAVQGLARLGYREVAGVWNKGGGTGAEKMGRAPGSILAGDSDEQVVRALRNPDGIHRTVTAGQVLEQWVYAGPPSFVIYLRRAPGAERAYVVRMVAPDDASSEAERGE